MKTPGLGLAVLTILAVSIAALATQASDASGARLSPACTAPPAPGAAKRTVAEGHAKPSSFAPQPRAPKRAYGTPLQRPILSRHKRHKHRATDPQPK